jgi:hypothetical protein
MQTAMRHDCHVTWWAVAIDNDAVGDPRWSPEGLPLRSGPPNEELVRSGHLTSTRNGFVAFRCSAKAEDSDSAIRLALDYYERYVGDRVTGITRAAAGPEGDLNM